VRKDRGDAEQLVNSMGRRMPASSAESFPNQAKPLLPAELAELIGSLGEPGAGSEPTDRQAGSSSRSLGPTIPGDSHLARGAWGGPRLAAIYVLTLKGANAVPHSRSAKHFSDWGPPKKQSRDSDPQCKVTRAGNPYLRSLPVQSAPGSRFLTLAHCCQPRHSIAGVQTL
ncbi:MAG TPA: hypothetical protein VF772_18310, partial [Terriglobales bacterium]